MTTPSVERLRSVGLAHGLDAVGAAPAGVFESTRAILHERKAAGLHGGMQFTYRNPDRSTEPARALPGARSLVVGARSYLRDPGETDTDVDGPSGAVARYVWEDHYAQLRAGLEAIAAELDAGGFGARILIDDNALVDREAAYRAGLGWYGKNTNLLLPGRGSWFVLGSVVTDAVLAPAEPVVDGCGTCERCLPACPTGAIVAPGVLDARRCLAWLVQATGTFPVEHRVALGTRVYGCDDCQEVCPPNRRQTGQPLQISPSPLRRLVPLLDLLSADDAALLARHGDWYIPAREPRYLRRNALVALGNTAAGADARVVAAIEAHLADPDPMLRAHAVWAAKRLGLAASLALVAEDPDPGVRAELDRDVPVGDVPVGDVTAGR